MNGNTPLHFACINDTVEEVTKLLDSGAEFKSNDRGETPMHFASLTGRDDIVALLLKRGFFDSFTNDRNSCAHYAKTDSVIKQFYFLAQPNRFGYTPMECAAFENNESVVRFLVNSCFDQGRSREIALQEKHSDLLKYFD